jgi:hypothetical protein
LFFFFLLCGKLSLLLLLLLGIPSTFHHQIEGNNNKSKLQFQIWQVKLSPTHLPVSMWGSTVSDYSSNFSVLLGLPDSSFVINFKLEIPNKDITHCSCNNYLWRTRKLLKCESDSKPDEIGFR